MLTIAELNAMKAEHERGLSGGDPAAQRRGARYLPLVEFALWAHGALVALGAEPLPEGESNSDPANLQGGVDGMPAGAPIAPRKGGKRRRGA